MIALPLFTKAMLRVREKRTVSRKIPFDSRAYCHSQKIIRFAFHVKFYRFFMLPVPYFLIKNRILTHRLIISEAFDFTLFNRSFLHAVVRIHYRLLPDEKHSVQTLSDQSGAGFVLST
jgi:hypothetical protein